MYELSILLGSADRVKLIRFFLSNTNKFYQVADIEKRTRISVDNIRKELNQLEKASLILKSKEKLAVLNPGNKNSKVLKSKEYICYKFNNKFRFAEKLDALMFDFQNANFEVLCDRFKNVGRMKLFILAGVFIGDNKSKVDVLYVGEAIKPAMSEKVVAELKAEIGREVNILVLDIEEYNYRYRMYDRIIRDLLIYKHIEVFNKIKSL